VRASSRKRDAVDDDVPTMRRDHGGIGDLEAVAWRVETCFHLRLALEAGQGVAEPPGRPARAASIPRQLATRVSIGETARATRIESDHGAAGELTFDHQKGACREHGRLQQQAQDLGDGPEAATEIGGTPHRGEETIVEGGEAAAEGLAHPHGIDQVTVPPHGLGQFCPSGPVSTRAVAPWRPPSSESSATASSRPPPTRATRPISGWISQRRVAEKRQEWQVEQRQGTAATHEATQLVEITQRLSIAGAAPPRRQQSFLHRAAQEPIRTGLGGARHDAAAEMISNRPWNA